MRALKRLPEPLKLSDKKDIWLTNFLSSGNKRPDSNKYAHVTIRDQLNSISFHKCFYCETKLKGVQKEVDHHIEVSVNKKLAYVWENLYLSCDNCNGKIPDNSIPVKSVLNPFSDSDEKISEHLTFEKELIVPMENSALGLLTIQKFRLDTELLDNRRLKHLVQFQEVLLKIRDSQITESRKHLLQQEVHIIEAFSRIDSPFSLMFKVLIAKINFD
jgi:hypothetical protein